jgi:hypothetical protein
MEAGREREPDGQKKPELRVATKETEINDIK